MSTAADPLLETLVQRTSGATTSLPSTCWSSTGRTGKSVDATWRAYFDKALGLPPEVEPQPVTVIVNQAQAPAARRDERPAAAESWRLRS